MAVNMFKKIPFTEELVFTIFPGKGGWSMEGNG